VAGIILSMKNSNDIIGNRTRDLPVKFYLRPKVRYDSHRADFDKTHACSTILYKEVAVPNIVSRWTFGLDVDADRLKDGWTDGRTWSLFF